MKYTLIIILNLGLYLSTFGQLVFTSPADAIPASQVGVSSYTLNQVVCRTASIDHCLDVSSPGGTTHTIISFAGNDGAIVIAPSTNPTGNCFQYTASNTYTGVDLFTLTVQNNLGQTGTIEVGIIVVNQNTIPNAGLDQELHGQYSSTITAVNPDPLVDGFWSVIVGGATLSTPDSPTSTISNLQLGGNLIRWNQVYPCATKIDDVIIYVFANPEPVTSPNIQFEGELSTMMESCGDSAIPYLSVIDDCANVTVDTQAEIVSDEYCKMKSVGSVICGYPNEWSLDLFGVPAGEKYYESVSLGYRLLDNGQLHVYGLVANVNNPNAKFLIDLWLYDELTFAEWSAQPWANSYKADCNGVGANHASWKYYKVGHGSATGQGDLEGSQINFAHAPGNYYFGFQLGVGANNTSPGYGLGGWITYSGHIQNAASGFNSDVAGSGDIVGESTCCASSLYEVAYTVNDDCGNYATALQSIEFLDTTAPILLNDVPVETTVCSTGYTPWMPQWQDDCSFSATSNSSGNASSYNYLETASDACGNSNTISFTQNFFTGDCDQLGCMDPEACNYDATATTDDGSCVVPQPANAGADMDLCNGFSATLNAINADPLAIGHWGTPSGTAIIDDPNSPSTAVSGLELGMNIFLWTQTYDCSSSVDVMVIYVYSGASQAANASTCFDGDTITLCNQNSMYMCANSPWNAGIGTWSVVSGCATIMDVQDSLSLVTNLCLGTNALVWTIDSEACTGESTSDTVYIQVATGACEIVGCLDFGACNYDPTATVDDGSCEYVSCNCENDIELPVITCPANISVNADADTCGADASFIDLGIPLFTDNCGISTYLNDWVSPNFELGMNEVIWTVTDLSGNEATCLQLVSVVDNVAPFIICLENIVVQVNDQLTEVFVDVPIPSAGDYCGDILSTHNGENGLDASGIFPIQTTDIIYVVTDSFGNTSSCTTQLSFEVMVGLSGCTDTLANNYGPEFSIDDGSCIYHAGIYVFNDLNSNGIMDEGEPGLPNWPVFFPQLSATIFSDINGYVLVNAPQGNYLFEFINTSSDWSNTGPMNGEIDIPSTYYIGLHSDNLLNYLSTSLTPLIMGCVGSFTPGTCISNLGGLPVSGTLTLTFDPLLNLGFTLFGAPDVYSPGFAQWNIVDILPGMSQSYFVGLIGPGVENVGFTYDFNFHLEILDSNGDPYAENFWTDTALVICAYDPNDLTPNPVGYTEQHYILPGERLNFMVRFQNMGNAPAEDILILNNLDAQVFNLESFQPIAASSNVVACLHDDGIVDFIFENIGLPSIEMNEELSHGYVVYRIDARDDLIPGTVLYNQADIFFDQNPAVTTNQTFHTIFDCSSFTPIVGDMQVCEGESLSLDATQNYVESYAWTLNGESISNDASIVLSSLTAGDYDVAVITSNPLCGETQSDVAVMSPLPDVNAGQDVSVCEGESVTLNGVSNDEITWSNGVTNGNEFVPNESTTLMASASNEFGCSAVDEMSIVVNPLPSNIIDVTGNTLSADNGNNYQWYFNGAPVNGATNQTFTANNSGNYFVEITSEEGCVILSETVIISSIEKGNDQSVSIYPNPMNLSATIILPNGIFQMDIFDMTGRCVFSKANCQGIMNIERNGMAAGRYSVQFKNAERFIVKELQVD